jgi:hypothetical protein
MAGIVRSRSRRAAAESRRDRHLAELLDFRPDQGVIRLHAIAVKVGQVVTKGYTLGTVGSTGRSTGPHLFFGVRWHNARVDPRFLLEDPTKMPSVNEASTPTGTDKGPTPGELGTRDSGSPSLFVTVWNCRAERPARRASAKARDGRDAVRRRGHVGITWRARHH